LAKSFRVFYRPLKAVCNPPHTVAGLQTRRERCWKTYGQVLKKAVKEKFFNRFKNIMQVLNKKYGHC